MSVDKRDNRMVQSKLESHFGNVGRKNKRYFETVLLG